MRCPIMGQGGNHFNGRILSLGVEIERPTPDQYFMQMARLARERSTCLRRKVGAVMVKDRHILTTGYNGAPKGLRHCAEVGCVREQNAIPSGVKTELCRGVHAEQNTIIQASVFGVSISGATLYVTNYPCVACAKMLINAEIAEIVYDDEYEDPLSKEILEESGIVVRRYHLE